MNYCKNKYYILSILLLFIPLALSANKEDIENKGKLAYSFIEDAKFIEAYDL